jgi:hypothetical protein
MAVEPCSVHGQYFRGVSQHAYPALVVGTDKLSNKLRLCPGCFDTIKGNCEARLQEVQYETAPQAESSLVCAACQQQATNHEVAIFVTLYERGHERRDFFGIAHEKCRSDAAMAFGLVQQSTIPVEA